MNAFDLSSVERFQREVITGVAGGNAGWLRRKLPQFVCSSWKNPWSG